LTQKHKKDKQGQFIIQPKTKHINNTQNNLTQKKEEKDKQGQFIIQPKTKHKTGLVFMKSQNKQTQRSKLRIPVLDNHFEVE
jgi:hypothetical protein